LNAMSATETVSHTKLEKTSPSFTGPVQGKLNFFAGTTDGGVPYNFVEKQPEGVAQTNSILEEQTVTINDIRSQPRATFALDKHAFEVHESHDSPGVDFWNDTSVKEKYYPEVEQLLKDKIPGTNKVIIFDHTVRRQEPNAHRGPVQRAHIDQTARSAALRIPLHAESEEEAQKLLQGRYRIVNVWRPINGPVESMPLAVGDSSTFPDENLVPVEHRYPDRTGETAAVSYSPKTEWWYLGNMKTNERLFLQCYDSVSGTRVPHTAFEDPRTTEHSRPRESIEVRALVCGQ